MTRHTEGPAESGPEAPVGRLAESLSRKRFLGATSAGAAAIGVMSAMPSLTSVVESPETEASAASAETMAEPMVAQVTDFASGEVSVMSGVREVVVRDPQLVARLVRALHP